MKNYENPEELKGAVSKLKEARGLALSLDLPELAAKIEAAILAAEQELKRGYH